MKNIFKKTNKGATTTTVVTTKTQGVNGMKNVMNKSNMVKGATIINEAAMIFGAVSLLAQGAKEIYHFAKERKHCNQLTDDEIDTLTLKALEMLKTEYSSNLDRPDVAVAIYKGYKTGKFTNLSIILDKDFTESDVEDVLDKLFELAAK